MLKYNGFHCLDCAESNNCEFSSDFCPRSTLDFALDDDIAEDPVFKKYREYYRRSDF